MKTNILVFDGKSEGLIATLSNKDNAQCPYSDAVPLEQLNKDFTFDFTVPATHSDTQYLVRGNLVGYVDLDGNLQVFQIYKTEEEHDGSNIVKRIYTEHLFYETSDDIVEDQRVVAGTASTALTKALSSSRWTAGTVDSFGVKDINFYYSNAVKNVQDVVNTYGGELGYRLVLSGNTISQRLVDLKFRRGADTGKRFEFTKDLVSVKRTVLMDGLKTALYGRGSGEQLDTGGYSRKTTFKDVVWTVAGGNPLDKPAGQEWIGSPTALSNFGRANGTRHRFGTFDYDTTDPNVLLQKTYEQLLLVSVPQVTYEMSVISLEDLTGYSHEKVRLGDTVAVIDRPLGITVQARVIEIRRDLVNPENTQIVLGNYLDTIADYNTQLADIQAQLADRKGIWDKADSAGAIDDTDISVVAPSVPTNLTATGLFKTIAVKWDFNGSISISAYELHASKTANFTPSTSTVVFRGKAGGYVHTGATSETWYFKLRALASDGTTASGYTSQVSASTLQIATADYALLSIDKAQIANLAVDSTKIALATITDAQIASLNADKITAGLVKAQYVTIGSTTTFNNGYNPNVAFQALYDPNWVYGKSLWSTSFTGQLVAPTTVGTQVLSAESLSGGGKIWQLTGQQTLFSVNPIAVDTRRKYKVSIRIRQTVDSAGTSAVYAGVATLDSSFNNITTGAGNHRYCAVSGTQLTSAMGWQVFDGFIQGTQDLNNSTDHKFFRANTAYVRPMFLVNYNGGTGTVEVDYIKFEDVTEIDDLQTKVADVLLKTTSDAIIATVRTSTSYQNDLGNLVGQGDLDNYPTNDKLTEKINGANKYTDGQVQGLSDKIGVPDDPTKSIYQQIAEMKVTSASIDSKFTNSGGVNQLRNSVGFAYDSDPATPASDVYPSWTITSGSITALQTPELELLGSGSGWFSDVGSSVVLAQKASIASSPTYTLSFLMKKEVDNATTGWSGVDVYVGGTKVQFVGKGAGSGLTATTGNNVVGGYEKFTYVINSANAEVEIRITMGSGAKATITNLMLNIGSTALQWQQANGETYTTNVLMDRQGITVKSTAYTGYTVMSPKEFAGYAWVPDSNNVLQRTKVFTLNKDVTEVSKLDATNEITMTPIKVVPVTSGANIGWAFVAE